jgi:ribosomal protein L32E
MAPRSPLLLQTATRSSRSLQAYDGNRRNGEHWREWANRGKVDPRPTWRRSTGAQRKPRKARAFIEDSWTVNYSQRRAARVMRAARHSFLLLLNIKEL